MPFIRRIKTMAAISNIIVPLSNLVCDDCKSTPEEGNHKFIPLHIALIEVDRGDEAEPVSISLDIQKISWRMTAQSEYEAIAEMSVQCFGCEQPHKIQHQMEAPVVFLKSLSKCKLCNNSLEVCDEIIEYVDSTDGDPKIHIQARLVCNRCSLNFVENKDISSPDLATLKAAKSIDIDLTRGTIAPHENAAPSSIKDLPRFKVAFSYSSTKRDFVRNVADILCETFGQDNIFYDEYYRSELARPGLDTYLQNIYRSDSQLVVVFLCEGYDQSEWCGLEWRGIRDIIKNREDSNIMLMKFDDIEISGLFSIDGFINLSECSPESAADLIKRRVEFS